MEAFEEDRMTNGNLIESNDTDTLRLPLRVVLWLQA